MRSAGIDYGARRIGIAISDESGTLARPVCCIPGGGGPKAAAGRTATELIRLTRELGDITTVVVGLPRRLDGTANEQTAEVEAFAAALSAQASARVVLQDERLTSREAEQLLAEQEPDWRARKKKLDAAAAAVILQEYLDRPHPGDSAALRPGDAGPASSS
jgi:putative Holliday junction resolvase